MNNFKLSEGSSIVLDLIRGLSAQIVVIGHGISFFGIFTFLHEPNFPWMQNVAVVIFFLLSGFLIPYSTTKKKLSDPNYGFKQYFIDRFSRIYTAFIPSLLFVVALDAFSIFLDKSQFSYANAFKLETFTVNLLMLQDFPILSQVFGESVTTFGSARPFWTLAIEWWIYMFFGFFTLVFLKVKKVNFLNYALLAFLLIVPVFNLINGRGNGLATYWIFGALVYVLSTLNLLNSIKSRVKISMVLLCSLLAFTRAFHKMEAYDPIFVFLLAINLWIIIDLFRSFNFSAKAKKFTQYNASFSYTLYLIHYSVLDFILCHFKESASPYLLFLIGFILSNLISILLGRYAEINLTRKVKNFLNKTYISSN